jgi:tRNA pseudouridine38-40 synthase
MPKYKITIEYDGTGIYGWQRQAEGPSVQKFIEEAIEKFSKEKVNIYVAGRTDAGVHALGQVAHFELEEEYPEYIIQRSINHFLKPNKIIILECEKADSEFHARFSAQKRNYKYIIINRPMPSVLDVKRAWHIRQSLDVDKMQEAANYLVGMHDFTSFRAANCQAKSPVKQIDEIKIYKDGERIIFTLRAPSFLYHMVRNIVGSLQLVGLGQWKPEEIKTVLEAKDRSKAGVTAPPHGLYFTKVEY